MIRLLLLAIVLPTFPPIPLRAQDALKLPPKLECKRDKMIGVKAGSTAKRITWEIPTTVDFQPKPEGFVPAGDLTRVEMDAGTTIVFCAGPGSYRLRCFAAVAESVAFAETMLIVGDGAGPEPTPPGPSAPFAKLITERYASITSATKRADAINLAAVYSLAAREAKNPVHVTLDELMKSIADVINGAVGADMLRPIREAVASELKLKATDGDQLTVKNRDAAAAVYLAAAAALEGCVK